MKLKDLLKYLKTAVTVKGSKEIEITGISIDSRKVAPGHLFIAKKGTHRDGASFVKEAIDAGAKAVITDFFNPFVKETQIIAENPASLEAVIAAHFYQTPSKELFVVGITGTKGKTTTSYLTRHLLEKTKGPTGLIGTIEAILGKQRFDSTLTTESASQNQKLLREMVQQGSTSAVLEVSSHGLEQGRVDAIDFDVAVFTNLYPDHLDYHQTMENYMRAKRKLFEKEGIQAVLNRDSPYFDAMRGDRDALSYGIETVSDVFAEKIEMSQKGVRFTLCARGQKETITSPLMGKFNIYNLLAAASVGIAADIPLDKIAQALSGFQRVPGRLERVKNSLGIDLFVDFAHSGSALEQVLRALKEIATGRILVIFGAGGNRPRERRHEMARAAEQWADLAIITTDNPRNESPEAICEEIYASFQNKEKAIVEVDRKKAIEKGIALSAKGDIVLIAGRGHEKQQIFAHQTIPFSDVEVAKEAALMPLF